MQRANLADDNSTAGGDILNAVNRWKLASGIGLSNLVPQWQEHEDLGYDENECRVTATGDQKTLGQFLYELETDALPVNLEECEIATRDAKGQQLTLTARFSFARLTADTAGGGTSDEPPHENPRRVSRARVVVALVVILGTGPNVAKPLRTASSAASPAPSGSPGTAPHSGYDAFRLFHTRNVFDPDRRPPHVLASDTPPPATPPPTRTDFVALTGTMLQPDRSLAFFSGSRAEFNKVLSVRDHIAGAEITQITPASIEIDRAGKKTQVSVGQTVPFDGSAVPGAAPDAFAAAPSTGSSAATGSSPGANRTASPSPGAQSSSKTDEIRRRLEEKRRQEQK